MSSSAQPTAGHPPVGTAAPAVPPSLQARLDELVDRAATARAALASGGAWRESLGALAATEDLADDLQHTVVDELRAHAPKVWSWSAIGRALGVTPQAAHTRFAATARARRRKRPATPHKPGPAAASTPPPPPPAPVPPAPPPAAPHPGEPSTTQRHQDMLTAAAEAPSASAPPTDTTTPPRPRRRRAAKDASYELAKSGDHQESHRWYVLADGERIGWVQPAYGATGRRKGWSGVMANLTPATLSGQAAVQPTRDAAAVQVIESWQQLQSRGASRRRQLEKG